jgi:hypothetical protein
MLAEIRLARSRINGWLNLTQEGIVPLAKEAAVDARPASGVAVAEEGREIDVGRHAAAVFSQELAHRSHARRVIRIGVADVGDRLAEASVGRKRVVAACPVADRANDGGTMHPPGHLRQVLANPDSGGAGGDGLELAAHLDRSVRLHVEHVLRRRTAVQEEEQDALRLRPELRTRRLGRTWK